MAKAHLDTVALTIRGGPRLTIPLAQIRSAKAAGATLHLETGIGTVELDLGSRLAATWRDAIVSPKSLLQKLGVRAGDRVCVKNIEDDEFLADLARTLGSAPSGTLRGTFDTIIVGVESAAGLAAIAAARGHLGPAGGIWIVYPKGKSSPVSEHAVRDVARAAGLYDAKVASFSATHTAMKAMIPLAQR